MIDDRPPCNASMSKSQKASTFVLLRYHQQTFDLNQSSDLQDPTAQITRSTNIEYLAPCDNGRDRWSCVWG